MNDNVQSSFIDKGIHYKIQLTIQQADTFSILLFDEDQPERWEGLFNGQSINKLTTQAGNTKKVQIFFKMLQNAILGNSKEVSFTIISQQDVIEMKNGSSSQIQSQSQSNVSQNNLNIRYFILEQHTEFDRVKYPLRLICKPYSIEELKGIIRNLRSENKRLSSSEQTSSQREKVQQLEQQIYDLNGSIRRLADEKDQVIFSLRRQITELEEKARVRNTSKNQMIVSTRQKTFRNNNSSIRNSNYGFSSGSNTRNTPTTKRKSIASGSSRTGLSSNNRYQSNTRNSRFSSASSSAGNSRRSSASSSRRSSAAGSKKNSAIGSARSSASNSRPSSRSSNGSFKRFNPTEWVMNHQHSGTGSRNNSRNQSPANAHKPVKRVNSSNRRGVTPTDAHLNRLHALVQKKYL